MSYSNILVAVAVTPESQQLLAKAVSIARPVTVSYTQLTLPTTLALCRSRWSPYH